MKIGALDSLSKRARGSYMLRAEHQECFAVPNMPKQPGDAVLCRDGRAKVSGKTVGIWWKDDYRWYHFAPAENQKPVVSRFFRDELKAAIPQYLSEG